MLPKINLKTNKTGMRPVSRTRYGRFMDGGSKLVSRIAKRK